MFRRLCQPSIRRLLSAPSTPLSRHHRSTVIAESSLPGAMADVSTPEASAASDSDEPVISIHRSGQLVEQGTHAQLLQRNGLYSQLARQPTQPVHSPPAPPNAQHLLWLDLEMTGLDPTTHRILEVAIIVTDMALRPHARYHAVVAQPSDVLDRMDDYVRRMHTKTGLLARVVAAEARSEQRVEAELCALVDGVFGAPGSGEGGRGPKVLLAGNTVHIDRRFIRRYWPELEKRLHYRIVDVSSWKEMFANLWGVWWEKRGAHEALSDVEESIAELSYYLRFVHITPDKLQQPSSGH